MQRAQSWFGFGAAPAKAPVTVHPIVARHQATASQQSVRERLQEQMLAQRMDIEAEQAGHQMAIEQAAKCKAQGNREKWKYWMLEEVKHREAEATYRGKLAFTEDQLRIHEAASSNLQHALILRDGTQELQATMGAMESLNVDDNIDEMQEHAGVVSEHDQIFSRPIRGPSTAQTAATMDLDDEWDRQQAQAVAARLPAVGPAATPTTTSAVAARSETPLK
jgi:membrane carboxypeptidase/penicillin-binding protein